MITVETHCNEKHTPLSAVQTAMRQIEARNFLHPKISILVNHVKLTHNLFFRISPYRPQTKFAKVMFLHVSVILSMGGCLPHCMLGYATPIPGTRGRHPPGNRHPPGSRPPAQCMLGATSVWYASYWNAYLLQMYFQKNKINIKMVRCVSCHFQVTRIIICNCRHSHS